MAITILVSFGVRYRSLQLENIISCFLKIFKRQKPKGKTFYRVRGILKKVSSPIFYGGLAFVKSIPYICVHYLTLINLFL